MLLKNYTSSSVVNPTSKKLIYKFQYLHLLSSSYNLYFTVKGFPSKKNIIVGHATTLIKYIIDIKYTNNPVILKNVNLYRQNEDLNYLKNFNLLFIIFNMLLYMKYPMMLKKRQL